MLCNSEKGGAYFFMEIVKTKKNCPCAAFYRFRLDYGRILNLQLLQALQISLSNT